MKSLLACIVVLGLLTGCISAFKPRVGAPWMQDVLQGSPPGPPNFQKGWRDGCETGISASANQMQKFFYKFKQDYKLAQNNEYYTGWKIGWSYCHRYVFQYYKRAPF